MTELLGDRLEAFSALTAPDRPRVASIAQSVVVDPERGARCLMDVVHTIAREARPELDVADERAAMLSQVRKRPRLNDDVVTIARFVFRSSDVNEAGIEIDVQPPKPQLAAFESGRLSLEAASATFSIKLQDVENRSYLNANVALIGWELSATEGSSNVTLNGFVESGVSASSGEPVGRIAIRGTLDLTLETVLSEAAESIELPAGTVWRALEGSVALTIAKDEAPPRSGVS